MYKQSYLGQFVAFSFQPLLFLDNMMIYRSSRKLCNLLLCVLLLYDVIMTVKPQSVLRNTGGCVLILAVIDEWLASFSAFFFLFSTIGFSIIASYLIENLMSSFNLLSNIEYAGGKV